MNMLQLLITGIIVSAATGFAVYRIISYFTDPLYKCDGCETVCRECPLGELRTQIENQKKSENNKAGKKPAV